MYTKSHSCITEIKDSQDNVMPPMTFILISAVQFYADLGYSTPLRNAGLDPPSWFCDGLMDGNW